MRTLLVCAVLATALLPARAGAQTVKLTESQALAQLGSETPRAVAARAAIDVARADILAAGRWPNPRFTFHRESVAGVAENMFMVAQPLPVTGRRGLDVRAATSRSEATAARAEDRLRRVRADVRLAFTDLWSAQEREQELTRTGERLNELADILGKREQAGDAAGFDRLRAQREVFDIDASRGIAATERARAQAVLASYIAGPTTGGVEAVRPSGELAPLPTIDELMARAETARGDLVALSRELDAASFAERAAARRAMPEPEVVAGTKSSNAVGGDTGSIVGLHLALPLFDRGGPERAAALARARQVRAEADVLRQTTRAQIEAWRAAVLERRIVADRHRAGLAGTEQIERIAQVSYEAGERGILELLDGYRTAAAARLRQADLDAAARQAEIELGFVSGWEIP